MRSTNTSVLAVGVFPPPIRGMTYITHKMTSKLKGENVYCTCYKLNRRLVKSFLVDKIISSVAFWFGVLVNRIGKYQTHIYLPLDAHKGIMLDFVTIVVAKLRRKKIILHHHSYHYINSKRYLLVLINKILGEGDFQVFLSKGMIKDYRDVYRSKAKTSWISNIFFMEDELDYEGKEVVNEEIKKEIVLGFLSNLTVEKGVDDAIELVHFLNKKSSSEYSFSIKFAGPVVDKKVEKLVAKYSGLKEVEFVGAVYGEEKKKFFESIDCFVFPTKYKNEAQPIVLFEALSYRVPLLCYSRGTIKHDFSGINFCWMFKDKKEMFLSVTADKIADFVRNYKGSETLLEYLRSEKLKDIENYSSFLRYLGEKK